MKPSKIIVLLVIGLFLYIGYKAIYALPDEYVKQADDFQRAYNAQKFQLGQTEKDFKALQASDDWEFLQPYADREEWADSLIAARSEFSAATKLNTEVITPITDRDHEDDIKPLVAAISEASALIATSSKYSRYFYERSRLILDARQYKESYFEQVKKIEPVATRINNDFIKVASKSKEAHPQKAEDINSKIVVAQTLLLTLYDQESILSKQHTSSNTDFALYGDTYQAILAQDKLLKQQVKENKELLQQLDRNYVKVLADQKVDYYIVIGRATWCESDGCGTGSNYKFPEAPVDADTFEYFDSLTVSPIADKGWGA